MNAVSVKFQLAALDWFTLVYPSGLDAARAYADAGDMRRALEQEGFKTIPWRRWGYDGYTTSWLSYGDRAGRVMISCAGPPAAVLYFKFWELNPVPTRLDLQITTQYDRPVLDLGKRAYEDAGSGRAARQLVGTRRFVVSQDGGQTAYIGSRNSGWFGRVYDKGVKNGTFEPGVLWRWEVQVNRAFAPGVAAQMEKRPDPDAWIGSFVQEWFANRGVTAGAGAYEKAGELHSTMSGDFFVPRETMEWLKRAVLPTVKRLAASNRKEELLEIFAFLREL